MSVTIFFDSPHGDDERRRNLYAGHVYVFSPVPPEVVSLFDPNPPADREGLVFKPPAEAVPAAGGR